MINFSCFNLLNNFMKNYKSIFMRKNSYDLDLINKLRGKLGYFYAYFSNALNIKFVKMSSI